jgi:hypothetical protein
MRKSILPAALLFFSLGAPTIAGATGFSYNFDLTDGPVIVTGTFYDTTGQTGAINFENSSCCSATVFISDSSANFLATLASPNIGVLQTGPSAWDVTPTSISFNFDAPASTTEFVCFDNLQQQFCPGDATSLTFVSDGEIIATNSAGVMVSAPASGNLVIAAAAEPGSFSMLLAGMLGLGLLVGVKGYRGNSLGD